MPRFFIVYLGAILDETSPTTWDGYHGTTKVNSKAILGSQFLVSDGDIEWLGHGAYFFIPGYPDLSPYDKAVAWAMKRTKEFLRNSPKSSDFYAVIRSVIKTEMHLDLDDINDIEMFTKIRQSWIARMKSEGVRFSDVALENDCSLANFAMDNLGLDALVSRESILTTENGFVPKSRHANCRIMCVRNPSKCILSSKEVKSGRVYG